MQFGSEIGEKCIINLKIILQRIYFLFQTITANLWPDVKSPQKEHPSHVLFGWLAYLSVIAHWY